MPAHGQPKKGEQIGRAWNSNATKVYLVVNENGLPWAIDIAPANKGEVIACKGVVQQVPKGSWLTGDTAYDAAWFRKWLASRGVRTSIRFKAYYHGGIKGLMPSRPAENPAVNRQRWHVERAFAWFMGFKRLNIRYERRAMLYKAFWHLAASMILFNALPG
jgi:transposase